MTVKIEYVGDGSQEDYSELINYLACSYPISDSILSIKIDRSREFINKNETGYVKVFDYREATLSVAAKDRFKRAVAITIAHEYKHCLQFMEEDLNVTPYNKDRLENEAKEFAEDVLVQLWKEQQIFYPSTL